MPIGDLEDSRQAMSYLINLGHRRIGVLEAIDPDQPHLNSTRSAGYDESRAEAGLDVDGVWWSATPGAAMKAPGP